MAFHSFTTRAWRQAALTTLIALAAAIGHAEDDMSAVRRRGLCPVRRIDGERAISAQIDSPGNVFQSVCAAVRINGFTPGVNDGNTLYNLSRSPVVREAKLRCSIWHWVPVSGRRWMGLVMVDSPGFAETVRVKVRDQEITPVVADRGDNRRHLYYWEEPFDFDFAETLEILTPDDDAPYVIEGFVFRPFRVLRVIFTA